MVLQALFRVSLRPSSLRVPFRPKRYVVRVGGTGPGKASGNAGLADVFGMYIRSVAGQEGQEVLLLYTGGGDSTSALGYGQLLKILKTHDVLVYSIGYLDRMSRMGAPQMQLSEMARQTGGESFFPEDPRQLNAIYAKILDELTSRYTIGYLPSNTAEDGKWRKIEVKLTRAGMGKAKGRSRLGFFARGRR